MTSNAKISPDLDPPAETEHDSDLRQGPRTAMFVTGTCISNNRVQPVRIRNMSRDGALLEGAILPAPGDQFELVRAHLRVSARSMWVSGNQCGVSFKAPIDVAEWMSRLAPSHQQQVDALVHQARQDIDVGRRPSSDPSHPPAVSNRGKIKTAITLLEELEGALADDALVIARHHDQLQALDRALQLLRIAAQASDPT